MQTINEYYSEETKKLKKIIENENIKTMNFTLILDIPVFILFFISLFDIRIDNMMFLFSTIGMAILTIYTIVMITINLVKTKDTKRMLKISLENDIKNFEASLKTK